VSDGAAAMVIATVEQAQAWGVPYARITGIDHRIENHNPCLRDLTDSVSTRQAAAAAGVHRGAVDIAEVYAPYSHQEILLTRALGLDASTVVNPSGGVLAGNLMMASGLSRVGEVFRRIVNGEAGRGVAHATSGPCLQHNLVAVLEGA
jgi:acetyl-CoA acetyltransferase